MKIVRRTATLADDLSRIAVIADTHSAPHPRTHELVAAAKPQAIVHAGDIGDHAVLDGFAAIAPLYAIRGNIDRHGLPDELVIDVGALRIMVVHIGVAGAYLRGDVAKRARGDKANLVVCGHSHVPFVGKQGDVAVFNPGSCGPRRFHLPIVFGTIAITPAGVKFAHVDCETGAAWLPP